MQLVHDENYINIQGWMVSKLELKGNDLLIYAIIYGFSQTQNQRFTGSLSYLAEWCNSTKQGVLKNLKNLVDRGLIEREDKIVNNVKFVEYYTTELNRVLNKVEQGIKQSLPNNIDNTIDNKIDSITLKSNMAEPPVSKSIPKRRVVLTDDFSDKVLEESKEEKKKAKRKNLYDKCIDEIDNYTDDERLRTALRKYLTVRLSMTDKKIYGANQWKGMLETLMNLKGDKVEIVKYATERGWGGFFELKDYQYRQKEDRLKKFGEHAGMKSVRPEEVEGGQSSGIIF